MGEVSRLTIEVPVEVADKLARLAAGTRRSGATIAGDALAAFVDHELDAIDGIRRALQDVAEGRVVSHEDAMAEIEGVLAAAEMLRLTPIVGSSPVSG